MFRTESSVIPNAFPACGLAAVRRCRPYEARLEVRTISGASRQYPDIRVAGICGQTKGTAPDFRRESEWNILSRARPQHKSAGIVIRYNGCYHPCVVLIREAGYV